MCIRSNLDFFHRNKHRMQSIESWYFNSYNHCTVYILYILYVDTAVIYLLRTVWYRAGVIAWLHVTPETFNLLRSPLCWQYKRSSVLCMLTLQWHMRWGLSDTEPGSQPGYISLMTHTWAHGDWWTDNMWGVTWLLSKWADPQHGQYTCLPW